MTPRSSQLVRFSTKYVFVRFFLLTDILLYKHVPECNPNKYTSIRYLYSLKNKAIHITALISVIYYVCHNERFNVFRVMPSWYIWGQAIQWYNAIGVIEKCFELTHGVHWNMFTHLHVVHWFSWDVPIFKVPLKTVTHISKVLLKNRSMDKYIWLELVGYGKIYPCTVQPDSSEIFEE